MSGQPEVDPSVAVYDRELVPWLFEHWAEPMVDLLAPEPSSAVVDLACGTGLIVRHLLGRLGDSSTVHGVDVDAAMLAYAAASVDDPRVSWHEADAAHLPFERGSVDGVSCHQGLQFFPDPVVALTEIRRILGPGGRLAVATWGRLGDNPWPAAMSSAVGRMLGEAAGAAMSAVCGLGDPLEVDRLLSEAGFEEVRVDERVHSVTHPDVRAAAAGQLAALPSVFAIDELSREQLTRLVELMCELLVEHIDASGRLDVTSSSVFACGVGPSEDSVKPERPT